jgi:hypothetical protein
MAETKNQTPKLIDARQPRLGQGITSVLLILNFVLFPDAPVFVPILAVVMGAASLLGPAFNVYAYLFKALRPRLGQPKELEEPWPPRFANLVGFIFLGVATLSFYVFDIPALGWTLSLIVAALAGLAATTGLCVGCEFYVIGRRILTKGEQPRKIVVHPGEAA